ncbi:MAG: hypothetical protein Q4P05_06780 [Actinomycetaceae bacterium]|nr:hypothetical protein [Actinomycetaceae bacterium]
MKYDESGRISILIIGLAVVVIAFVLTSATITIVHLQRRALYTCNDAVAVALATRVDASGYYSYGKQLRDTDLKLKAGEIMREFSGTTCAIGHSQRIDSATISTVGFTVEMSTIPEIPLLPAWLQHRVHPPRIRVASTATVH